MRNVRLNKQWPVSHPNLELRCYNRKKDVYDGPFAYKGVRCNKAYPPYNDGRHWVIEDVKNNCYPDLDLKQLEFMQDIPRVTRPNIIYAYEKHKTE